MNPLDYRADLRVRCLLDDDEDFTKGRVYECFWIGPTGNAKVIDNDREENYLLFGEYELVEELNESVKCV